MSNAVKWALLAATVVALIVVVLTFPFVQYLPNAGAVISEGFGIIVFHCYGYFYNARAFINIFLTSYGRLVLSGLIVYFFTSWIVKLSIKITTWIFHFIFK